YEYNQKVMGINIATLRNVNHSIAVCTGKDKASAILGAINGGYINTLITDYNTAMALDNLDHHHND
ncbi:MAG: sugar-binding domain-containing protein, partial [Eubacterium sp.]